MKTQTEPIYRLKGLVSRVGKWSAHLFHTVFAICLLFSYASAQNDYREGYVVHMSGDTSYGWIDYGNPKSNAKYCLFKTNMDDEPRVFYPDDLLVYRFANSKFYFSKEIERTGVKKRYFLEYLLDGVVELYYHADPFKDYFYIEKDGRVIELSNEEKIVDLKDGRGKGKRYAVPFTGVFNYIM